MPDDRTHIVVLARSPRVRDELRKGIGSHARQMGLAWRITCIDGAINQPLVLAGLFRPDVVVAAPGGLSGDWPESAPAPKGILRCVPGSSGDTGANLWFDDAAVGREAARHLIETGWRRALVLASQAHVSNLCRTLRERSFVDEFRRLGGHADLDEFDGGALNLIQLAEMLRRRWSQASAPLALFGYQDGEAAWLIQLALSAGLSIPDQIGVIGCEDTEVAASTTPSLSSVRTSWMLLGCSAGLAIQHLLVDGRWILPPPVAPIGVAERESTRRSASLDPWLTKAERILRQSLPTGMEVQALASRMGVSGETLRRRVRAAMGCDPRDWIRRLRLHEARRLLLDQPGMTVSVVAKRGGWTNSAHLARDFRAAFGQTPHRYRLGAGAASATDRR